MKSWCNKKTKNKVYRFQYGEVGLKNIVWNRPPISLFVEPEKTVFRSHVANENVKYGTPSDRAFFDDIESPVEKTIHMTVFLIQIPATNKK